MGRPTDDHINIATEVANSLAIAIHQARLFEQVQAGRDRLQILSRQLVEAQEVERRFIAQELHDQVGQLLTGLKLTIQMNENLLGDEVGADISEAKSLVNELLKQVRDLSLDLRPAMLDDLGLLPALLWHIERYKSQTGIEVSFEHMNLDGRRFPPEVETAAYRIAQEALTNVARHAQVENVILITDNKDDTLTVEIRDQGVGIDPTETGDTEHSIGLLGMRERAMMLGGTFNLQSKPDRGTSIKVALPLKGFLERRNMERR
jgi:signal transduction histidine kinase